MTPENKALRFCLKDAEESLVVYPKNAKRFALKIPSSMLGAFLLCDLWFGQGRILEDRAAELKVVKVEKNLDGGKNPSYLVTFVDGSRGVFKPKAQYNSPESEVAAYKLDRLLGFGLVPLTVLRKIKTHPLMPAKFGSLQIFVENSFAADSDEAQRIMDSKSAARLILFDFISANDDHRLGNFLVKDSKFIAIDNGESFANTPKLDFNILKEFPRLMPHELESLGKLRLEDFRQTLSPLVGAEQAGRAFGRLQQVLDFYKKNYPKN